jgi:hypothetical protein
MSKKPKTIKISDKFEKKFKALTDEFPGAKFVISCFDNIGQIQKKKLCKDDVIYYQDFWGDKESQVDTYVIKKPEGQTHILYKDVIHQLIDAGFSREGYDHKFMEDIGMCGGSRNPKLPQKASSFFGS